MRNCNTTSIPPDTEIIDLTGLSITSSDGSTRGSDHDGSDHEISEDASMPWYQDPNGSHPFSLVVKGRATSTSVASFTDVEFFPWAETQLEQLWNGEIYTTKDDPKSRWSYLVTKWKGVAAMCGGKVVRLISMLPQSQGHPIFQVSLAANCQFTVSHVKWALNPWNLHPLLLYTHSSVLHIFDVEALNFLGCIRGHGGDITSIGVHHFHPHLVFTTSRDCTTRVYDFRITAEARNEKKILPIKGLRNPFGTLIDNDGGECALGKCIVVFTGGRSGGHEAAVLGADFHASLPLIATCGVRSLFTKLSVLLMRNLQMDHALRIWHLGPVFSLKDRSIATIYREDKPLFSSTMIHDARVISIHWLSHEILMSHSAPRVARINGKPVEGASGTLIVWQWLSVGRFFPPGSSIYTEPPLRGCISDYRESSSFKVISSTRLPVDASRVSLNRNPHRPPIILIPVRGRIMLINACHLPPRRRPSLIDDRDLTKLRPTKKVRLTEDITDDTQTEIEGWSLNVAIGEDLEDEDIVACVMSPDGRQIAAVGGVREGMWMWQVQRIPG